MLDIRLIRDNPDLVREALKRRGDTSSLDDILAADRAVRRLQSQIEISRARINELSRDIGRWSLEINTLQKQVEAYRSSGLGPETDRCLEAIKVHKDYIETAKNENRQASDTISRLEPEIVLKQKELEDYLLRLPNLPHYSVPPGKGSEDNPVLRTWGDIPQFPFTPKPHWEIGEKLGIIDFERGVKLSGTRFYVLRGLGSRLQRALINFMLDLHVNEHGYTEIYPPFMVKGQCLYGSGNLPKFGDNLYHDAEEDLWWVPTAEVPLTNLHRDEIMPPGSLPIHYVAYTACFRREKMAAGKDTRGIKRGHQFDKVELYKFVEPDKSFEELEKLLHDAEEVAQRLGLPYRIVQLCTADLGFASAKSYDVEMWAPGCGEWLEVSSCSNCVDFQARRASIRFRPEPTAKPQFVHTLNGSGLALPRVVIALLENYQQADGSVVVPEALRLYMGVDTIK